MYRLRYSDRVFLRPPDHGGAVDRLQHFDPIEKLVRVELILDGQVINTVERSETVARLLIADFYEFHPPSKHPEAFIIRESKLNFRSLLDDME